MEQEDNKADRRALSCQQESLFEDLFPRGTKYEIFYDRNTNCLIFRQESSLFQVSFDNNLFEKLSIPYKGPINEVKVRQKDRYVAYSVSSLYLYLCGQGKQDGKEIKIKTTQDNEILAFEWIQQSERALDIVICKQKEVGFYKIEGDKLKEYKIFSVSINCCWYEPLNQILCCSSASTFGKVYTFYCENRGSQMLGAAFKLDSLAKKDEKGNNILTEGEKEKNDQQCEIKKKEGIRGFLEKHLMKKKQEQTNSYIDITGSKIRELGRLKELMANEEYQKYENIEILVMYKQSFLVEGDLKMNKIRLHCLKQANVSNQEIVIEQLELTSRVRFSVIDNMLGIHMVDLQLSLMCDTQFSSFKISQPSPIYLKKKSSNSRENQQVKESFVSNDSSSSIPSHQLLSFLSQSSMEEANPSSVTTNKEKEQLRDSTRIQNNIVKKKSKGAVPAAKSALSGKPQLYKSNIPQQIDYKVSTAQSISISYGASVSPNKTKNSIDSISTLFKSDSRQEKVSGSSDNYDRLSGRLSNEVWKQDSTKKQEKERETNVEEWHFDQDESENVSNQGELAQIQVGELMKQTSQQERNLSGVLEAECQEDEQNKLEEAADNKEYTQLWNSLLSKELVPDKSKSTLQLETKEILLLSHQLKENMDDQYYPFEAMSPERKSHSEMSKSRFQYQLDNYLFTPYDTVISPAKRAFYKVQVHLFKINTLKNNISVDIFALLTRRKNTNNLLLSYLRLAFNRQAPIKFFQDTFRFILSLIKRNCKDSLNISCLSLQELQDLFFYKLYCNNTKNQYFAINRERLTAIALEYCQISGELDFTVRKEMHTLLAQLMIESGQIRRLIYLIQYREISNNEELALLLLSYNAESPYPPSFQAALDMLFGLRKFSLIVFLLLKHGKFQQALEFMKKYNLNKINLKQLIGYFFSARSCDMSLDQIVRFFKQVLSNPKTAEKYGFTLQDFLKELQIQKKQYDDTLKAASNLVL